MRVPNVIDRFDGDARFLSNFYHSPVYYRTVLYETVEHAYQASKTLSLAQRDEIRREPNPAKAKRLGRRVKMRHGFDAIKLSIMYELVKQKFTTYPALKKALLATADAELVEGNHWRDVYWGVCEGVGANNLGKILMRVRAELRV